MTANTVTAVGGGTRRKLNITKRDTSDGAVYALATRLGTVEKPVPVPDYWQGYWLIPDYIETWKGSRDRIHERMAYAHQGGEWTRRLLQP